MEEWKHVDLKILKCPLMRYAHFLQVENFRRAQVQSLTAEVDTLGIEPRASRMLSGCDTTTPCALMTFKN